MAHKNARVQGLELISKSRYISVLKLKISIKTLAMPSKFHGNSEKQVFILHLSIRSTQNYFFNSQFMLHLLKSTLKYTDRLMFAWFQKNSSSFSFLLMHLCPTYSCSWFGPFSLSAFLYLILVIFTWLNSEFLIYQMRISNRLKIYSSCARRQLLERSHSRLERHRKNIKEE